MMKHLKYLLIFPWLILLYSVYDLLVNSNLVFFDSVLVRISSAFCFLSLAWYASVFYEYIEKRAAGS